MPALENRTPFAAIDFLSATTSGADCIVLCVAGRFDLPRAGRPLAGAPALSEAQIPPPIVDTYWGEPGASSLRHESQATYHRPTTDVYVIGHAHTPRGLRVPQSTVRVQVGRLRKQAMIFGRRVWQKGLGGLVPSKPEPFLSIPLTYERSFGGVAGKEGDEVRPFEHRNPIGVGLYIDEEAALDSPLPNIEDPDALITTWTDRPAPLGFGPVARSWGPRIGYAGTYDERWVEERAPLWPLDFDLRFFQAAAPGLIASSYLKGGELVTLDGVSSDGAIGFTLPLHRLAVQSVFRKRVDHRMLALDAVQIEPDERSVTLIWRAAVPAHREIADHEFCLIRELEAGEELPA